MNDAVSSLANGYGDANSLVRRADFALGDATVRPSLRLIEGPSGTAKGEPRVIQVLVALANARGAVLSRDDLLRLCWEGRIVGDDAINRAVAEVRRIAAAVGADFQVETVARVGYRLAGVDWGSQTASLVPSSTSRAIGRRRVIAGGIATVAVLASGGAAVIYSKRNAQIDYLIERGRVLRGSGGPDDERRAELLFRQAIKRDPDRADAWGWLASVLGDPGQAREAASRALELDPREANARAVLALQRRDLDTWTQWEDVLLRVLADAPDNALSLGLLTHFYQGLGRCKDSWITNERSIRVEPFNPSHQHKRALKHWIFGRIGEADKVADQGLRLWPRNAEMWNARMVIYAATDRAQAGLALLDDESNRPINMKPPSVHSWRVALQAIATRSPPDLGRMIATFNEVAPLAPGIAANAIMMCSYLGEIDDAFRFAEGLFAKRGAMVQRTFGMGIRDVYSEPVWGRTQFLFIPATTAFRADTRFPDLCRRMGHVAYWQKRGIWPDPFVRGALDPAKLA